MKKKENLTYKQLLGVQEEEDRLRDEARRVASEEQGIIIRETPTNYVFKDLSKEIYVQPGVALTRYGHSPKE